MKQIPAFLLLPLACWLLTSKSDLAIAHIIGSETAPYVDTNYNTCMSCIYAGRYWCAASQECYYYSGAMGGITGFDCTRPEAYADTLMWSVPKVNQF